MRALVGTDSGDLGLGVGRNDPSIWRGESKFTGCGDAGDELELAR